MTDWAYEPLSELLPARPTPFTWSILGASCERAIRSYYAERGYDWPDGVTLLRLEAGEVQGEPVYVIRAESRETTTYRSVVFSIAQSDNAILEANSA